jgi:hypothetical protein
MKRTVAPISLAGSQFGEVRHVCAFFNSDDEEYRVLLPFIKDGFECGDKHHGRHSFMRTSRNIRVWTWPARFEPLPILSLAVSRAPANVRELRTGTFDGGFVEPQQNGAALFVQRVVNQLCRRRY